MDVSNSYKNFKNFLFKTFKKDLNFYIIILFLSLIGTYIKVFSTIHFSDSSFLNSYAFFTSDSYDWISNGVNFTQDFTSIRNPGLPIIIFLLSKINSIYLIILINQIIYYSTGFLFFKIIKKQTQNSFLGLIAFLAFFLNYTLNIYSMTVLADLYSVFFITLSLYFIQNKKFKISFLSLSCSMLFQNFAYFLLPFFFGYFLYTKNYRKIKTLLKHWKDILINFFIAISLVIPWHTFKFFKYGDFLYTKVTQLELVNFQTQYFLYYLIYGLVIFGPLIFLSIYVLKKKLDNFLILNIVSVVFTFSFWTFFYEWGDKRFLIYLCPFIFILGFYGLSKINYGRSIRYFLMFLIVYLGSLNYYIFSDLYFIPLTNTLSIRIVPEANGSIDFKSDVSFYFEKQDSIKTLGPFYIELIARQDEYYVSKSLFQKYWIIYQKCIITDICIKNIDPYSMNAVIEINTNQNGDYFSIAYPEN